VETADFKPTNTSISRLRIALVLGVLMFGFHLLGQEDSVEESETIEVDEGSSEEAVEDTDVEESENDGNDSENSTSRITDEDASATQEGSNEAEATNEDTPNNDETEDSEDTDTDHEDFVPTENLSEDIDIPFPVDI